LMRFREHTLPIASLIDIGQYIFEQRARDIGESIHSPIEKHEHAADQEETTYSTKDQLAHNRLRTWSLHTT